MALTQKKRYLYIWLPIFAIGLLLLIVSQLI